MNLVKIFSCKTTTGLDIAIAQVEVDVNLWMAQHWMAEVTTMTTACYKTDDWWVFTLTLVYRKLEAIG